jgi:hypothetical protein
MLQRWRTISTSCAAERRSSRALASEGLIHAQIIVDAQIGYIHAQYGYESASPSQGTGLG